MFGRRQELALKLTKQTQRRQLTEEEEREEAIQAELADLPDDEGMEDGGAAVELQAPEPGLSDLRRRPRRHEPSDEEEEHEEGKGDEPGVALLQQELQQHEHLKRRHGRHEEDHDIMALQQQEQQQQQQLQQEEQQHQQRQQQQQQQQSMARRPVHEDEASAEAAAKPPEQKRARLQREGEAPARVRFQDTPSQPSTATQADAIAQVTMALSKLIAHVGNPAKFPKAAPLLRQLLEGESLSKEHRPLAFEALRAAFPIQAERSRHLVDPVLRREVIKLLASAQSRVESGYFNKAERLMVTEVFHLIGGVRHQMQTDDSFIFSKVLASLRKEIGNLPEATGEEDDEAYERVMTDRITANQQHEQDQMAGTSQAGSQQQQQQQPVQAAAPHPKAGSSQPPAKKREQAPSADDPFGLEGLMSGAGELGSGGGGGGSGTGHSGGGHEAAEDDDPFSLNSFFEPKKPAPEPPKPKAPKPKELPSKAYDHTELMAARRRALLDCVHHARTFHKHAWAQTAIELTAEHCWQNKSRFCTQLHEEVDELWRWVRSARAMRKRGPSAKEINRDTTSFERASDTWSRMAVPTKGKVGAQGDAKATQWLG